MALSVTSGPMPVISPSEMPMVAAIFRITIYVSLEVSNKCLFSQPLDPLLLQPRSFLRQQIFFDFVAHFGERFEVCWPGFFHPHQIASLRSVDQLALFPGLELSRGVGQLFAQLGSLKPLRAGIFLRT